MNTNKITIEAPEGMELDTENSVIKLVWKEKIKEPHFPDSVTEIEGRDWYITENGIIEKVKDFTVNQLSSRSRAVAFLALMQLVELRDYVNGGWEPDWSDNSVYKYCIEYYHNDISKTTYQNSQTVLFFKSEEIRDKFLKKYRTLIEQAKELL